MQYWQFYKKNFMVLVLLIAFSCKENTSKTTSNEPQEDQLPSGEKKEESKPDAVNNARSAEVSRTTSLDLEKEVKNFIICKKAATERNDCRNAITKVISKSEPMP